MKSTFYILRLALICFVAIVVAIVYIFTDHKKNNEGLYENTYDDDFATELYSVDILETKDGYFIVVERNRDEIDYQTLAIKVDKTGKIEWKRILLNFYYFVALSHYGDLILIGDSNLTADPALYQNKLVVIDSKGNVETYYLEYTYSNDTIYKSKYFQLFPGEYLVFFNYIGRDGTEVLCPYTISFFKDDVYIAQIPEDVTDKITRFLGEKYLYTIEISDEFSEIIGCYKYEEPILIKYDDNGLNIYLIEGYTNLTEDKYFVELKHQTLKNTDPTTKELFSIDDEIDTFLEFIYDEGNLYVLSQKDTSADKKEIFIKKYDPSGKLVYEVPYKFNKRFEIIGILKNKNDLVIYGNLYDKEDILGLILVADSSSGTIKEKISLDLDFPLEILGAKIFGSRLIIVGLKKPKNDIFIKSIHLNNSSPLKL